MKKSTSYAPLILGIIGGILGIIGGACTSLCASVAGAVGFGGVAIGGYMILISALIGLIGGCIARSTGFGSLMMVLATVLEIVGMILYHGWPILAIIATILFLVGGIVGFVKHE